LAQSEALRQACALDGEVDDDEQAHIPMTIRRPSE